MESGSVAAVLSGASALIGLVGVGVTVRGGARLQRARHVREDADRVLDALAALRDGYRVLRARPVPAPEGTMLDALEDALTLAAARLSEPVTDAARAYVRIGRLFAVHDGEHGRDAEVAAFGELWAAVVAERNVHRS